MSSVKCSRADSHIRRFIKSDVSETHSVSIIRVDDADRVSPNIRFYKSPDAAVCPRKLH
jgi:hypothetical protein